MRAILLGIFGAFILAGAPSVAADAAAAEKRALQRKLYRDVRTLLDESDIATGSSRTIFSRSSETPCRIAIVSTPDAISGGREARISIDLRKLDFQAVVPGVHIQTWEGVDHRTHVLFIEHTKSSGIDVSVVEYRERPNGDGFTIAKVKWDEPHVLLVPRRPLEVLLDEALSNEANRRNVQRLHTALAELAAACRE